MVLSLHLVEQHFQRHCELQKVKLWSFGKRFGRSAVQLHGLLWYTVYITIFPVQLTLMLLRLTSVRLLSLLWILSRVSSTLVVFGGSSGKILNGSAFTTPVGDTTSQVGLPYPVPKWHTVCYFHYTVDTVDLKEIYKYKFTTVNFKKIFSVKLPSFKWHKQCIMPKITRASTCKKTQTLCLPFDLFFLFM